VRDNIRGGEMCKVRVCMRNGELSVRVWGKCVYVYRRVESEYDIVESECVV